MRFDPSTSPYHVGSDLARASNLPFDWSPEGILALSVELGLPEVISTACLDDLCPNLEASAAGHRVTATSASQGLMGLAPQWLEAVDRGWEVPDVPIRTLEDVTVLYLGSFPIAIDSQSRVIPELSARVWPLLAVYDLDLSRVTAEAERITDAFLATGDEEIVNYCHFALDAVGRIGALWSVGIGQLDVLFPEPAHRWQHDILGALRVHGYVPRTQAPLTSVRSRRLFFTDDYGNRLNLSHPAHKGAPWALEFLNLLSLASPGSPPVPTPGPERIFVSRADASRRRLLNERRLLDELDDTGLHVARLTEWSFQDQAALFRQAGAVIGVHGAGLANAAFMRPGTSLVEITGGNYAPPMFQMIAKARGLRYAYLVGENVGADSGLDPLHEDIYVDVKRAAAAIRGLLPDSGPSPSGAGT